MRVYAIIPVSRFSHAKTRLSPTLAPPERENLLKAMLRDVSENLNKLVDGVVIISADWDVLHFAYELGVEILEEKGDTDLNGALEQAIEWCAPKCDKVLIVPSDVPLVAKADLRGLIRSARRYDMIIAPSKGGGTNALMFQPGAMRLHFGDCSFFKHIKEAKKRGLSVKVYDSFYLSLDVNTAEDLGEIILHGDGTFTKAYLEDLKLKVKPSRGVERLQVQRGF